MPRVVLLMCCTAACALARDTLADGGGQLTSAPPVPGATESDATPAVNLALSIRKQLMEGNYEYTGSEEQAGEARRSGPLAEDPREGPPHSDSEQRGDRPRPHRYLLDEADGRRHYVPYTFDRDLPAAPAPAQIPNGTDPPLNATSPKLKYKLIEVPAGRKRRSGRRSGRRTHSRRFIQEEGAQGVALINLGSRPFPEFRLPAARRQYMQDQEDSSRPLRPRRALAARRQYMQDQGVPLRLHPPAPPRPAPTADPGTDPAGRIVETDADSAVKERYDVYNYYNLP